MTKNPVERYGRNPISTIRKALARWHRHDSHGHDSHGATIRMGPRFANGRPEIRIGESDSYKGQIRIGRDSYQGTPSGVPFPALILSGFSRCGGLDLPHDLPHALTIGTPSARIIEVTLKDHS